MLNNIDSVYMILWAAVIGISCAVVYTNLQRTALSKFINALIDNKVISSDCAKTCHMLGINGIYALIIKSAVKNQHGLMKIIHTETVNDNNPKEEAEILLSGNRKEFRYSLVSDENIEEIKKKYSYKSLNFISIVGIVIAVIVTAFILTKAVDIFDSYIATKNASQSEEEQKNSDNTDETKETDGLHSDFAVDDSAGGDVSEKGNIPNTKDEANENVPAKPSIPMGPPVNN